MSGRGATNVVAAMSIGGSIHEKVNPLVGRLVGLRLHTSESNVAGTDVDHVSMPLVIALMLKSEGKFPIRPTLPDSVAASLQVLGPIVVTERKGPSTTCTVLEVSFRIIW